ncbi:MAG TPA: recombinase family protein [Nitrolancea sp.]|nr:recombinase family protein [Nitrolancea sp.]
MKCIFLAEELTRCLSLTVYARVATDGQNLSLQRDALTAVGCGQTFTDTTSGNTLERSGLAAL